MTLFNFEANGMIWKVSYDPAQVHVTKLNNATSTTPATWEIVSELNAIAHVQASPDGSSRNRTDEGYFYVPFKITVTK